MKKILLGTVGLMALSLSVPANAADLAARPYVKAPPPVVAIYDWSGFYLGINGGGGSSHKCWDLVTFADGTPAGNLDEGCHDATGGTIGGQLGYRWQIQNWVFGLEGQGNWADFTGSHISLIAIDERLHSRIDAFGLFTGQIGYAWNNVLFYVKGGGAVVSDKFSVIDVPTGFAFANSNSTRWGGALGAGLEFGFAPNWSVGVEYDHLFLGGHDVTFTDVTGAFSGADHIKQSVDMGLVRVNYRWGGPVIAKY